MSRKTAPTSHGQLADSPAGMVVDAWALFPALYVELRRLARSRLARGGRSTLLDTSSLVHEAFLRMQRDSASSLRDREHFMAYAASTMRSVIVDGVRRRQAQCRGGDLQRVTLDTQAGAGWAGNDEEVLDVHRALETLAQVDARLVRVVEMRYFGGMSDVEIGEVLGLTERTVRRDWERARLLLAELLGR